MTSDERHTYILRVRVTATEPGLRELALSISREHRGSPEAPVFLSAIEQKIERLGSSSKWCTPRITRVVKQ
jgi:hypothetical protein